MSYSRVLDALLRTDFPSFAAKVFQVASPGVRYLHNWHIDLVCEALEDVRRGHCPRLMIAMPPRMMKSLLVSVAWPAWLLAHNPAERILASSYAYPLALKHSLDCRRVMASPWYRRLFPQTILAKGENRADKFSTTGRGFRLAASVGASIIGEGGNTLIADDPLTPAQAFSPAERQACIDWFTHAFLTRLDDKQRGVAVVVMQRLHDEDLIGYLLREKPGWKPLILPAVAEEKQIFDFGGRHWERQPGTALHPARENLEVLAALKQELGSYVFSAQYQQNPLPLGSGLLRRSWLKYFRDAPQEGRITQSWDTAVTTSENADWTVCATWAESESGYYLLDIWRERVEYPELRAAIARLAEKWNPAAILVEDKASGQPLLQELRANTRLPLIPVRPQCGKLERLLHVLPLFEAGKVRLPQAGAAWLADYEAELLAFPHARHDDQVDATTQYLQWVKKRGAAMARIRRF